MTLVSIVGDFYSSVLPVFYEFQDKITTHIILSDDSKRDDFYARQIEKGINKYIRQNSLQMKNYFYSIDEDSYESLDRALEFILKNQEGELYINTTDGYAMLNTYFSLKTLPLRANIITYDMYDNEYHITNLSEIKRFKITNNMNIKDHFMLKGIDVLNSNPKSFAEVYENELKSLFIYNRHEYRHFIYEMTVNYDKMPRRSDFPNVYAAFDKMGLTGRGYSSDDLFKKVTGEMFEYFVYLQIKDLGFDDIMLGVEIDYNDANNEFDILCMKDNHLHVIECKYRRKKLDLHGLIYKYSALRRIIDEDGKSIIVSLIDKYNKYTLNRALTHNIALLGLDKNLKENIKKFLLEDVYDRRNFEFTEFKTGFKRSKKH